MTIKQEEQIAYLRRMGESYGKISESLGVSVNTVKSFCQRKLLGGKKKPLHKVMRHSALTAESKSAKWNTAR